LAAGAVPEPGPAYWASFGGRVRARIDASLRRARLLHWTAAAAAGAAIVAGLALLQPGRGFAPASRAPTIEEAEARLRDAPRRAAAAGEDPIEIQTILDDIVPADTLEESGLAGTPA